jgi:hypothetical protein
MIIDILLFVVGTILTAIGQVLPDFQLWPDIVFEGWRWFITGILDFNVFLPVVYDLFDAATWFIHFLSYYFLYKLTVKGFNYLRGAGDGL